MKNEPIHKLKSLILEGQLTEERLKALRFDSRKGVQNLLLRYDDMQKKQQERLQTLEGKWQFERQFCSKENGLIAGVDEAGRGPLAGPVVAAAVVLQYDTRLVGLTDSKQLTVKERNKYYHLIKEVAVCYHISIINHESIDKWNILEATKKAMIESLSKLKPVPTVALIDAVSLPSLFTFPTKEIIKGDDKSIAIAAASILAKVTRDEIMNELDSIYPAYGFSQHKGYGTAEHLKALSQHGLCPYHRRSFAPVKKYMNL